MALRKGLEKANDSLNELLNALNISLADAKEETDLVKSNLKSGSLVANTKTGEVVLNNVTTTLNPKGKQFKFLLKLMNAQYYQLSYEELIEGTPSGPNKRNLTFIVRDLKKLLGINDSRNENIFENIKNYGYKLIAKSH